MCAIPHRMLCPASYLCSFSLLISYLLLPCPCSPHGLRSRALAVIVLMCYGLFSCSDCYRLSLLRRRAWNLSGPGPAHFFLPVLIQEAHSLLQFALLTGLFQDAQGQPGLTLA